jgi:HlyD family secretion protein
MIHRYLGTFAMIVATFVAGCANDDDTPDAYGHFETKSVAVSAERSGLLVEYAVNEGALLEKDQIVGLVDTSMLAMQRILLHAKIDAAKAKIPTIVAQSAVIDEQIAALDNEIARFRNLFSRGAATMKQVDDMESQRRVLVRQIELQSSNRRSLEAEIRAISTELQTIDDQVRRSIIRNPIMGTVLQSYAERHEMAALGKPLYTVASLDTLDLRIYVTGDQLSSLQLGMKVNVYYDVAGGKMESVPGYISTISTQAEFTPKFLKTKDERTSMVYAVLLRVGNNGKLNVGMPAEVMFN